jgi:hypothetical protein
MLIDENGYVRNEDGDLVRECIAGLTLAQGADINETQEAEEEAAEALAARILVVLPDVADSLQIGVREGDNYFVARVGGDVEI